MGGSGGGIGSSFRYGRRKRTTSVRSRRVRGAGLAGGDSQPLSRQRTTRASGNAIRDLNRKVLPETIRFSVDHGSLKWRRPGLPGNSTCRLRRRPGSSPPCRADGLSPAPSVARRVPIRRFTPRFSRFSPGRDRQKRSCRLVSPQSEVFLVLDVDEERIPLDEVPRHVRTPRPVHKATAWRWALKGWAPPGQAGDREDRWQAVHDGRGHREVRRGPEPDFRARSRRRGPQASGHPPRRTRFGRRGDRVSGRGLTGIRRRPIHRLLTSHEPQPSESPAPTPRSRMKRASMRCSASTSAGE